MYLAFVFLEQGLDVLSRCSQVKGLSAEGHRLATVKPRPQLAALAGQVRALFVCSAPPVLYTGPRPADLGKPGFDGVRITPISPFNI